MIIEKQQKEIEALNDEVRHLKKLKGKPRIRPNKPDNPQGSDADEISSDQTEKSETPGNHPPPKAKRQDNQNSGQTSAPERQINHEKVCHLEDVQPGWRNKGYQNFYFTELALAFSTTLYRRECWQTLDGRFLTAPLPPHVKGHFGDQLKSLVLDLHHSCCVTQPLLLSNYSAPYKNYLL